jgi:hypothetical protein
MTAGTWTGPYTTCPTPGVCAPQTTTACAPPVAGASETCTDKCVWGACACPGTQSMCKAGCVDTQSDANNCGKCENPCPAGGTCSAGKCSAIDCAPPQPVDMCGNCGTRSPTCDRTKGTWTGPPTACTGEGVCSPAKTQDCSPAVKGANQTCGLNCTWGACACANNLTMCKSGCVDTKTDNANCGGCESPCPAGSTCTAGRCPIVSTDAGVPQSGTGGGGAAGAAGLARLFDGGPSIESIPR